LGTQLKHILRIHGRVRTNVGQVPTLAGKNWCFESQPVETEPGPGLIFGTGRGT